MTGRADPQDGWAGHAGLGAEVRGIAVAVLDRLGPALDRVRAGGAAGVDGAAGPDGTCGSCPVCAVLGAIRRDHPELAERVAEQAASMLAVLRAALEDGGPATGSATDPAPPDPTPEPARRVQRIPVERVGR